MKEVYLYGSYARGDNDNDSGVDIMIVLDDYQSYWQELVYSGELISDLSLKYGLSISRVIMNQKEWQKENTPFLRNIRAEGIAA